MTVKHIVVVECNSCGFTEPGAAHSPLQRRELGWVIEQNGKHHLCPDCSQDSEESKCRIDGCTKPRYCRQMCSMHYARWENHGDPTVRNPPRKRRDPWERFEESFEVDADSGCWLWNKALDRGGYGQFTVGQAKKRAHRYAYEALVGPIPEGLTLDHLCRVPRCVNPAHLEPVTSGENTLRGNTISAANMAKTHCSNGHEFTPENTYRPPGGPIRRMCKECTFRKKTKCPVCSQLRSNIARHVKLMHSDSTEEVA